MIAVEEQNIRTNISSRTSPLLQSVFLQCKTKVIRFYYQNKRKMQKYPYIDSLRRSKGIIIAVKKLIYCKVEGNITYIDQHVDVEQDVFFYAIRDQLSNPKWI
jgi:hypothetical protein